MKRTGITRYLTLSLAALMSINLVACGSAKTTDTESTKAEAASQQEDIENAINKVVGNGQEGGADKEETVYVFTDANGNTKNITVSNWLKNVNGNSTIKDASTLTDIENVEGDEKYTANGDNLTWKANGNDIYYQGKTNKKPPVSQQITYYLDGKAVDPDDLAGKSGHVKIHIDYTNTEKYNDVYVPFTAVTGLALNNENVKNVKVDHGSVVSEGKHTVVVGMAFPGLQDSLQSIKDDTKDMLDQVSANQKTKDKVNDLDIPSSVDIEMDATDFQLSTALTMVFSNLLTDDNTGISSNEVDKDHDDALDEMDDKVNELTDDGDKLADGATELSDGIKTANDNMPSMKDGTKKLADGVKEYTDGVTQVDNGVSTLKSGTSKLAANSGSLKSGANQLDSGISTLKSGTDKLVSNNKSLVDGANQLDAGVQKFMSYASAINSDGGKSLKNQVGTQAQSQLLNSDEYKTQKKQMLDKVNGISGQFDDSKAFINKYFNVAYKAATDPSSMSASERSSYNAVKNNDQFKQLVSSIQGSAPQVTAAVTNALAEKQDDLNAKGEKAVKDKLTSTKGQDEITEAVSKEVYSKANQDKIAKDVSDAISENSAVSNAKAKIPNAVKKKLSNRQDIQDNVTKKVTTAIEKNSVSINNAVTKAVTKKMLESKEEISNAVSASMNSAFSSISASATKAATDAMTSSYDTVSANATKAATDAMTSSYDTISSNATKAATDAMGSSYNTIKKNANEKASEAMNKASESIQGDVSDAVSSKMNEISPEIAQSINEAVGTEALAEGAKNKSAQSSADLQNYLTQLVADGKLTRDEAAQIVSYTTTIANESVSGVGEVLQQNLGKTIEEALKKTAETSAVAAADIAGKKTAEVVGEAVATSAATDAATIAGKAAATSAATDAATIAGKSAATSAAKDAASIAGKAAATSAAKDAATIAGEAASNLAAQIAAKEAGSVGGEMVANIAANAALSEELVPDITQTVGEAVGEAIANVAAEAAGKDVATMAANAAATQAATMTSDVLQKSVIPEVATIAGGAAAMTVGQSTMNQTLDTIKATMNKQLGDMNLSTTIDQMSGKIAYNVGSGVVDQLLAQVMGSNTTAGLSQLSSGTHQLASGIKSYTDGVSQVASGANQLKSGSSQLASGISTYTNGVDQVDSGVNTLKAGTSKLTANNGTLVEGTQTLSEGAQTLADGMAKLLSGSVELKDGVVKFNDEGIKKLADLYNTDVKSLDNKVQELKDAAKSYKTFSGAASDEDSTVKFIYKMDSIETDDKND